MKKGRNVLIGFVLILILGSFANNNENVDNSVIDNETEVENSAISNVEKDDKTELKEDKTKDDEVSKTEVIEETLALDVASNDELIDELIELIDYDSAYEEYKSYFSKSDIEIIQEKLHSYDINCGSVDGYIGKKTIASIIHFQEFKGLNVTGIVTEETAKKMGISYSSLDADENKNGKKVTMKLSKCYLDYNNSVGNDWGTDISVNGESIRFQSSTFKMTKGDTIRIKAEASEADSVVDYGSSRLNISYNDLTKGKSYSYEIGVIVTENRGRYSGNSAKWIFIVAIDVE